MEKHEILILLTYYERPELVKGTLSSLVRSDKFYSRWKLAFIDDGSELPGRPIAEKILGPLTSKAEFYNSRMSPDMKKECGGCFIGYHMNEAIRKSSSNLVIMLGDDDEVCPDYLFNLDKFFTANPWCKSCYCDAYVFDPMREVASETNRLYSNDPTWVGHEWFGRPINAAMKVDGIQVAWRSSCSKVDGAWLPYPISINHDAAFFQELYERSGPSHYCGCVGVYKGRHEGQLVNRGHMTDGLKDKKKKVFIL